MSTSDPAARPETAAPDRYLTLRLDGATYALPVAAVREIRALEPVTPVPGAAPWILGVLNLRGHVVPVMDLRARMGLPSAAESRLAVIVLLEHAQRVVGAVVDAVVDVIELDAEGVGAVPELGAAVDRTFLAGMATVEEEVVLPLCVQALVGATGLEEAGRTPQGAAGAA